MQLPPLNKSIPCIARLRDCKSQKAANYQNSMMPSYVLATWPLPTQSRRWCHAGLKVSFLLQPVDCAEEQQPLLP